jgi:hypothetical protein
VTFGRELVVGFNVPGSAASNSRGEELNEEVWEHMVLRSTSATPSSSLSTSSAHREDSNSNDHHQQQVQQQPPPLLGASALAHASKGAAHALNAPPLV